LAVADGAEGEDVEGLGGGGEEKEKNKGEEKKIFHLFNTSF